MGLRRCRRRGHLLRLAYGPNPPRLAAFLARPRSLRAYCDTCGRSYWIGSPL